jgi:LmbE family N-acetylglucosaminyl deacetylase
MNKKILIVVAHPDDEVLGCFGTVARLIKEGYEAYTLILSEGRSSRDSFTDEDLSLATDEITQANMLIGITKVYREDFPDNRFDSVDLLDIVKAISKVKEEINPDIIFTHFENDLNIDHSITYKALLTATRPLKEESVTKIYSFEVLSSTEWNFPLSFSPNIFYDIDSTIDVKLQAMKAYSSELREYPHPRSLQGIKLHAQQQGMRVGREFVESFMSIREIR